jgi:very-short-patch-repair endonuclease
MKKSNTLIIYNSPPQGGDKEGVPMTKGFFKYSHSSIGNARRLRREMTDAERKVWSLLRHNQLGVHFKRQAPIGPYISDFLCMKARIVVELDGNQHYTQKGILKDKKRDAYLEKLGLTVLHYSDYDALTSTSEVIDDIYEHLLRNPTLILPLQGRIII